MHHLRFLPVLAAGSLVLAGCAGADHATSAAGASPAVASAPMGVVAEEDGAEVTEVTVTGQGSAAAVPDSARLVLGVEVTRPDVSQAFADANGAAEAVLQALLDQGVDEQDIKTSELSVREQRPSPPAQEPPGPTGFVVINLVTVTVDDIDRVGDLVSATVEAGGDAARIRNVALTVEDRDAALEQAREAAFDDAEARAQQYADLVGRELGELRSLSEVTGGPGPAPASAQDFAGAPVLPGQEEITLQIEATWSLE